mmetsp:Transcript_119890/g.211932  ORF Transcript_119890/g.211932 Transcript_119890/m.211932 type:complete len:124 (+) Transcript_119890:125-496(+)
MLADSDLLVDVEEVHMESQAKRPMHRDHLPRSTLDAVQPLLGKSQLQGSSVPSLFIEAGVYQSLRQQIQKYTWIVQRLSATHRCQWGENCGKEMDTLYWARHDLLQLMLLTMMVTTTLSWISS